MLGQLEEEKLQLKRVQSMLRMLERNIYAYDMKRFEQIWLRPIVERKADLELVYRRLVRIRMVSILRLHGDVHIEGHHYCIHECPRNSEGIHL